uniref:Uncharacterized protein n=1 Tax=Haptolina brevifila TaxID=156173 RepID=A0A7S2NN96_9EUKA|mmetsp:Transcript_85062/g.169921  ORF Transcript_85062/g.169921 Transcript_85062/m.169921 type:complete len:177 (+) Transcript_85062:611-1141(+)
MAGGMHWPKWLSESIHTPLRPFGTHAYVISERGAKKLLAAAPRASYHVDVVAWGVSNLRLFAVHPLLAKQTHGDTTIGGAVDRSWLPNFIIDDYTGTDFAWAWNAPLFQIGGPRGVLVTSGRGISVAILGLVLYAFLRLPALFYGTAAYTLLFSASIRLLSSAQSTSRPSRQHLSA